MWPLSTTTKRPGRSISSRKPGIRVSAEVFRFYRTVRQLGLNVDIVPQGGDLTGYRLIIVPPLPIVRPEFLEALRRSSGTVLFGPRLGSKTEHFRIPDDLPPGSLQEFLPLRVQRVDSLPSFAPQPVAGMENFIRPKPGSSRWRATWSHSPGLRTVTARCSVTVAFSTWSGCRMTGGFEIW